MIDRPALAAPTIEDAKLWVAEGDRAQDMGDCKTAVSKYRQALGVKETAQIYLRIGACQETDGQLADALQSYRSAKPLANEKTGPIVDEKVSALTPRVPGLTFVVPADKPPEMRIEVNGISVADLARETSVNPGAVTIVATATGMAAFNKTVNVAPGEHQRVDIVFTPAPEEPHDTPKTPGPRPSIPGIILGAVGVAGIGVGIGLVVHGFGIESELVGVCGEPKPVFDCTEAEQAKLDGPAQGYVDSSNAFKGGGWAALGIGAAAATVGGVLLGLSLGSEPTSKPPAAVYPIIGERAFGLGALGSF